ncbi:hypothetical protein [Rummeliibacillus suwonensis]|uniref:hypothetical protein n=1 Tax=Rummeliibacillus suwonensis TaxID=1306154 RepID=UPI0035E3E363
MLFYDFEVFDFDWLVVITDTNTKQECVFINDDQGLIDFYNQHKKDIWIGYNSRHYDQYILKAIICGFTPQEINHWIIAKHQPGWKFYRDFWKIQLFNYDVMTNKFRSLKQLEGFMGHDIKESSVSFNIHRKLTEEEIKDVTKYCRHDVHETISVFMENIEEFQASLQLIKIFKLPMRNISKTKAQLVALICGAKGEKFNDNEFEFPIVSSVQKFLMKYRFVLEWYKDPINHDYSKGLDVSIAGVPHAFAWGGIHGARKNYINEGFFINIDVTAYYPSIQIEYKFGYRNMSKPKNFEMIHNENIRYKKMGDKKARLPFKIADNSISGQLKDKNSKLFDPLMNNAVCVNGQLMLLLLIEMLEPHCQLIQSNTDGILIKLYNENDYDLIDDIVYRWERLTGMEMEFDEFVKVIQKDVNNYILVAADGSYKTKGSYVKKQNSLDYDLPIVNEAIVNYFVNGVDPEETIFNCTELIKFQKIVKLSHKYDYARYGTKRMNERVFRLFASVDKNDKELRKVKNRVAEKIAYAPERSFIINDDLTGKKIPMKLDYWWYLELADKRINDFVGREVFKYD